METVLGHRLDKILQAVDGPFHFFQEPPGQNGELGRMVDCTPVKAVADLIEFAS